MQITPLNRSRNLAPSPTTSDQYVPRPAPSPQVDLLPVPDTRQSTVYSCGAAAMQAVLMYYGEEYIETDLMEWMKTDPENGTHPQEMKALAEELGYKAELRENMSLNDLEKAVEEKVPVIVAAQAWKENDSPPWSDRWDDGHYMVVVGLDKENVYFEDPSILGSVGVIPRGEFLDRWHDVEGDGRRYQHAGLLIKGDTPKPPGKYIFVD